MEGRLTDIQKRKTRLVILTPYRERGREIIAEVKPWGLEMREKGRRLRYPIPWGSIYHRAAELFAEEAQRERKRRREERKKK